MTEPLCDIHEMLCKGAEALSPADPGPPYLMIDLYPWDLDNPATPQIDDPNWSRFLTNPELVAVVLKATDGLVYGAPFVQWFKRNFLTVTSLFGQQRGVTRFAGGYHFLQATLDGDAQAVFYLKTMLAAGWGVDDIVPIIDVEAGNERHPNRAASRAQWIDNTSKFSERCRKETGRGVMGYGRNVLDDFSISSRMGCDRWWNPSYTREMYQNGITGSFAWRDGHQVWVPGKLQNGSRAPWSLDDIGWWQAIGDGKGDNALHHIPLVLDEIRQGVDISVCIDGARKPTMRRVRSTLL